MLSKEEKAKLKQMIAEYAMAEIDVGRAKSLGGLADEEAVRKAVHDASRKMEVLISYIDKEIS